MSTTSNDSAPLPPDKFPVAVANIRGSVDFAQEAMILNALHGARRAALEEALKIARGAKEDGLTLAKKAHAESDEAMANYWRGEMEGAAEVERDIMNLLGIDWANGETEVRR